MYCAIRANFRISGEINCKIKTFKILKVQGDPPLTDKCKSQNTYTNMCVHTLKFFHILLSFYYYLKMPNKVVMSFLIDWIRQIQLGWS